MLLLSRNVGERIRIGANCWLTILEVRPHGKVRLGFAAPADVEILREELVCKELDTFTADVIETLRDAQEEAEHAV